MRRFALALAVVAWLAAPAVGHAAAPAADVERALADLAGADADRREAAVTVLGKTGDPKWLAFLAALRDGSVYARNDGQTSSSSSSAAAKSTQGDQDVIEIKGAVRRRRRSARCRWPTSSRCAPTGGCASRSSRSSTPTRRAGSSPTPTPTCAAAPPSSSATRPTPAAAPVVEAALAKETDPWVRHALAEALALIRLAHGDAAARGGGGAARSAGCTR